MMLTIHHLEIHVAHACNLACESCSHYSNQGHRGLVSLEDAESWMQAWSGRLVPRIFSLVGGEPTVHPQLAEFVLLARRYWPTTHLRLVTNGFFLHRHPDLPAVIGRDRDACIYLSIHHESQEYLERLQPALALLDEWRREHGVRIQGYRSAQVWTRRYRGLGSQMQPYDDGQPRKSWEHCDARYCPQLFDGQIWKCAALAYLPMQDRKYGLPESWHPYLGYRPLAPDCSDQQMIEFFEREHERYCGMCPASPEHFSLPSPMPQPAGHARLRADGAASGGFAAEAPR